MRDSSYLFKIPLNGEHEEALRLLRKYTKEGIRTKTRYKGKGFRQDAPKDKAEYCTVYIQDSNGHNCIPVPPKSDENIANEAIDRMMARDLDGLNWIWSCIRDLCDKDNRQGRELARLTSIIIDREERLVRLVQAQQLIK